MDWSAEENIAERNLKEGVLYVLEHQLFVQFVIDTLPLHQLSEKHNHIDKGSKPLTVLLIQVCVHVCFSSGFPTLVQGATIISVSKFNLPNPIYIKGVKYKAHGT